MDVTQAWARDAATAAARVPAHGVEARVWTVRGWAEVAAGCAVLDAPTAFAGLDAVVRRSGIAGGGVHATRLRALRAMAGPVPPEYPAHRYTRIAGAPPELDRRMCGVLADFCDSLWRELPGMPPQDRRPMSPAAQLAWGSQYRPSPLGSPRILQPTSCAGLVRRAWMRLPCGPCLLVTPRRAPAARLRVQRGVHEAAHLDHLAATQRTIEFGAGLLAAEAYAMAVEVLATVECLLDGDAAAAWWLTAGLAERVRRLPGGRFGCTPHEPESARRLPVPAQEFGALPRLAATYVTGPLTLLCGDGLGPFVPEPLGAAVLEAWARTCAAFSPAAELTARARRLLRDEAA